MLVAADIRTNDEEAEHGDHSTETAGDAEKQAGGAADEGAAGSGVGGVQEEEDWEASGDEAETPEEVEKVIKTLEMMYFILYMRDFTQKHDGFYPKYERVSRATVGAEGSSVAAGWHETAGAEEAGC